MSSEVDSHHKPITDALMKKILNMKKYDVMAPEFFTDFEKNLIEDRYRALQQFSNNAIVTPAQESTLNKIYKKLHRRNVLDTFRKELQRIGAK